MRCVPSDLIMKYADLYQNIFMVFPLTFWIRFLSIIIILNAHPALRPIGYQMPSVSTLPFHALPYTILFDYCLLPHILFAGIAFSFQTSNHLWPTIRTAHMNPHIYGSHYVDHIFNLSIFFIVITMYIWHIFIIRKTFFRPAALPKLIPFYRNVDL